MFIRDSYLLTESNTFELKGMQEVTVNIELIKAPHCYHTILVGRVLDKNKPIPGAVVKVYDRKYKPLFHTITNSEGIYRFCNILAPGAYKVVVAAAGYKTSKVQTVKIKAHKITRKSFQLKKCSMNGIVYGKVRVAGSNKPIEGAMVYLKSKNGLVYVTTSNKEGQYIIYNIRPNKYKLFARKHGYKSTNSLELKVAKNDRIRLNIDLKESKHGNRAISGVVAYDAKPVSETPIFLYKIDHQGDERLEMTLVTNEVGAFYFTNLMEGDYILKLKLQSEGIFEKKVSLK